MKGDSVPEIIKTLAARPHPWAWSYFGYIINGFKFHTVCIEMRRLTQNSGVMLSANIESYASARDRNPVSGGVNFYGRITDIVEIWYSNDVKFVLFKCDWVDNKRVMKVGDLNFVTVNFKYLLYQSNKSTDEPFILTTQAMQVWYVLDPIQKEWEVVMKMIIHMWAGP